jgi:hypothetical protein
MTEPIHHTSAQVKILNKFRKRLEKEKYINNYASNYYANMNNRFVIPGVLITGISSVLSFLATSDILTTDAKQGFSVGVGILTAGATIIQSVSSSFGFATRKDSFQASADAYDDLITRLEFEICNPNEEFMTFCNALEADILKIKTDCKYLPPLFIRKLYEEEAAKLPLDDGLDSIIIDPSPNKQPQSSQTVSVKNQPTETTPLTLSINSSPALDTDTNC